MCVCVCGHIQRERKIKNKKFYTRRMIYDKHTSMTHLLKILCEIKKSKINILPHHYHTSIILNYTHTHIHSHLYIYF